MADFDSFFNTINALQESDLTDRDRLEATPGQALQERAVGGTNTAASSIHGGSTTDTRVVANLGSASQLHGGAQSLADPVAGVGAVDVIMSDSGEVEIRRAV
ncbi:MULTISPECIES: hypothetical protein [unclassified Bradyrhizobium]|uniref:hypothetical protein n=1 Tax=unclassified Bradyrhizobium TaxID=2631580 RepID=UPI001FF9B39E|nr:MULTISPECIES: hypothetical protein [unclassified Bradyrhizobium]MCK1312408.1 hypothetical protein [Bradyrhizobium sp. 23]MCK1331813.1 hypothetical protein [Bradyrhizobium sp. CW9]MCK1505156.1 hypothetical protein [Bradyrhizobium sp. 18]MCK1634466.1 hypothetical protein [Bradyrhizobium sp. 162]MCK1695073.1 hypothetical protein [Bradyrhizobium sp. 144]